ncbi:hypothetical protein CWI38_0163p0020 [Hamiltosporidium tvaerminnensis]|uniref:DNA-directed DNA polymerase n=2 Tax=Hamiltosporidium tvaerminnensis TaxID=1176355 RepID=A0A4Q9M1W5_9MICR|nr:hypothetical protein CWI38_0163p0020 [Hamiltosporidium tvaerminnensis]
MSYMNMIMFMIVCRWFFASTCCLKGVKCATPANNDRIKFGLIDINWRDMISVEDLASVEYWLSRPMAGEKSCLCSGNHFFIEHKIHPKFFVCSLDIAFENHEPLHIFEVDYRDDWNVRFRVLNEYLAKNEKKPFVFKGSFCVTYQLFNVFVKYMKCDSIITGHNLSYKLFYRLIKLIDLLDPVSSECLNEFYTKLYQNGLMNVSAVNILKDPKNYRIRYFKEKRRQRPFMYFLGAINESLNACLIPDTSMVSIFQKKNQSIDQCFRYTESVHRLVLKISANSLEILMAAITDKMRVFNWLLTVTKISGYFFDNTEYTFNPIRYHNICGFLNSDAPKKCSPPLKALSYDFFAYLSDENTQRISYLKFMNVEIDFDLIGTLFGGNILTDFEVSFCSIGKSQKITELLTEMPNLNVLILRGFEIFPDDVENILCSKIRLLVLYDCAMCQNSIWKPQKNLVSGYEILNNLRTLNISYSRLPFNLVEFLLKSVNLNDLFLNFFEFQPSVLTFSVLSLKRQWDRLEMNGYVPNDYLSKFFIENSVEVLSLSQIKKFSDVRFIFFVHSLKKSVISLNLSDNSMESKDFELIDNFKNLEKLNLASSLPLDISNISDLRIFELINYLDISRNIVGLGNSGFICSFKNLSSLSLAGVKIEAELFKSIFTDVLCDSLVSLDLSGVDLCSSGFQRILNCKKLEVLRLKVSAENSLSYYCDCLLSTTARHNLSILNLEFEERIDFDDLLTLAGFSNLYEAKISCSEFVGIGVDDMKECKFKNSNFRLELCLSEYNVDSFALQVLCDMFSKYMVSIVCV